MSVETDPLRVLTDLAEELDGKELQDIFIKDQHKFLIRLLTEEELNWSIRFIDPSNVATATRTLRLPTLAMSIREIDGSSVENKLFDQKWLDLDEDSRRSYESKNKYAKKYFAAEHLMEWLAERPPTFVQELEDFYNALSSRRDAAQVAAKNSSGEGSEKEENPNSTDPSPTGEQ